MGAVVAGGEVDGERVAGGLDHGAEEGEGAEVGWVGVEGGAHLLVHPGEERLVRPLHDSREVHQEERPPLLRHGRRRSPPELGHGRRRRPRWQWRDGG